MARVRYFAAAAEAAGRESEVLEGATLGEVRASMVALHGPELERVLRRCAVLMAGVRAQEEERVGEDDVVDVLPPFAGG